MKQPKIITDLTNTAEAIKAWEKSAGYMPRNSAYSKRDVFDTDWQAKLGAGVFFSLLAIGLLYFGFLSKYADQDIAIFCKIGGVIILLLGLSSIVFQAIKIGRWKTEPIIKVPSLTHWRNDYPWPEQYIKGSQVNELNNYVWGFIIFLAFMIGWTAINVYGESGVGMMFFTGLFWLIGVFFAIEVVKRVQRYLAYGASKLHPPQMPIVLGALQPIAFENKRVAAKHSVLKGYLRFIQEEIYYETDSEGNRSQKIRFKKLYEKPYTFKKINDTFQIDLEIDKNSPPNQLNIDPCAYWVLDVVGVDDFETSFLLPVYDETRMV